MDGRENIIVKARASIALLMQSYPPRVLDRRVQEDWARATKEGPRVLMNLRVDF